MNGIIIFCIKEELAKFTTVLYIGVSIKVKIHPLMI